MTYPLLRFRLLSLGTLLLGLLLLGIAGIGVQAQTTPEPLLIAPKSGAVGTLHLIFADDLASNAAYRLVFVNISSGETILELDITSANNGSISYNFVSNETYAPGEYDVSLYEGDTIIRAGVLTIEGPPATATPSFTPAPTHTPLSTVMVDGDSLIFGEPRQGELNDSTAFNSYTFTAPADTVISLRMDSADFDAYLLLLDSAQNVIMRNDNGGGNFNAAIAGFKLPADDTYSVIATSRQNIEASGSAEVSGGYTLLLSAARFADSGTIVSGETVIGRLSADLQEAEYTFSANAGDVITVDLASDDFDPFVAIRTASGSLLASDDDSGPALYARIENAEIVNAGDYTIVVRGFGGPTGRRVVEGEYLLSLRIVGEPTGVFEPTTEATIAPTATEEDDEDTITQDGEPQPITYGETVQGELTESVQVAQYSFEGSAGDAVTIALDSDDFDPLVVLLDSGGNVVSLDDDAGPGVYALISGFELPADDTYTIVVDGYRGVSGDRMIFGEYTLSLASGDVVLAPTSESAQPTLTPLPTVGAITSEGEIESGQTVTGALGDNVQTAQYSFSANAGDVVTIDLVASEFDPLVRLLDADGNQLTEDDDSGGGTQAQISDFAIPETGTYIILVDTFRGFGDNVTVFGSYTLTLEVEAGIVEAQPTETPESRLGLATPQVFETETPQGPRIGLPGQATQAPENEITILPDAANKALPLLQIDPITASAIPINVGEVTPGSLYGVSGEALVFTVEGTEGEIVAIYALTTGTYDVDTILRVFAPDGSEIAVDDDSGQLRNSEILPLTLPQTGEYRIVVQPYIDGSIGSIELFYLPYTEYNVRLEESRVYVTDKEQQSPLIINGEAGETLRLVVKRASTDAGTPTITVVQNDVVLAATSLGTGSRLAIDFVVPEDGSVTVLLGYEGIGGAWLDISVEAVTP